MKRPGKGCLIGLISLVVVILLLVAGALLYRPKLAALAKEQVDRVLHREGLFIDYSISTGGRIDGIITIYDITAYRTRKKEEPIASLDRMIVRFPLRAMVLRQELQPRLVTRSSTFTVYGEEENPTFENISTRINCLPGALDVESFQALFQGIKIRAAGKVLLQQGSDEDAAGRAGSSAPDTNAPTPESGTEASSEEITSLDFSPVLQLAPPLDYRSADWTPVISAKIDSKTGDSEADAVWNLSLNTQSFPSKDVSLTFEGTFLKDPNDNVSFSDLTLGHDSGNAVLSGNVIDADDLLQISNFESRLDWVAILRDHPSLEGGWDLHQVTQTPTIKGSGTHHLEEPEQSDLQFTVRDLALDYGREGAKSVAVTAITADGTLNDGLLTLRNMQASLARGNGGGQVTLKPFEEVVSWSADIEATHLYLDDFAPPGGGNAMKGFVDVTFSGEGADQPAALQGRGDLKITNGDFFHARVLGPMLSFLHKISPNQEKGNPDELQATFVVQNGVIRTDDLALEISEASIRAAGTIDLTNEQARFEAQAKLRGPLGISANLIGEGPLDNVEWRRKGRNPNSGG